MSRTWIKLIGLTLVAGTLAGCGGGRAIVTRRPKWNYEHYNRIAVIPARPADPHAANDARLLADRLTTLLTQNGAFTVLSRTEMSAVFQEQDLSNLADMVDEGTALPEGKIKIAQALVVPKITDYKLIKEREQRTIPRYARDRQGRRLLDRRGQPIIAGQDTVYIYTHGAEVEGSVRVVDAATGKILFSDTARIAPRPKTSQDRPPSRSPEEMASEAVAELATDFYKNVAPTKMEIKLDSDMLIIATDYFDGRYAEVKKLAVGMSDFLLAVRDLPDECDRNDFRVAVSAEEGHENLFEQQFTWSGGNDKEGVQFKVPMEPLVKCGSDRFVAKLYAAGDPEPVMERKFSLAAEKAR